MENLKTIPLKNKGIRALRFLSQMRGWRPLVTRLSGPHQFKRGASPGTTVPVYGGHKMAVSLDSFIEWSIYSYGGYEASRIDLFRSFVPKGGVLLDVGANIGNHSIALCSHFDEVHAFEPNPDVFARLENNIRLNPGCPISSVNAGLGDQSGSFTFYKPEGDNQGTGTFVLDEAAVPFRKVELPIIVGDGYVEAHLRGKKIAAINVDVQGFEPFVLHGLRATIERHRPAVWMEVTDSTRAALTTLPVSPKSIQRFSGYRQALGLLNRERLERSSYEELRERNGDYLLTF